MRIHATIVAALILFSAPAWAQLSVATLSTPIVINFDSTVAGVENGSFAAAGFQSTPTAGQLDSDAFAVTLSGTALPTFGGTQTSTDFTRGTSSTGVATSSGGIWAFNTASTGTNIALGMKPDASPASDFEPGAIFLHILNSVSVTVDQITVSYKVFVRNDQSGSSTVRFSSSGDNSTYNSLLSLDVASPTTSDITPAWVATSRSTTLTGLSIAPGASFYLEWNVFNTPGNNVSGKDELGLDDISITADSSQSVPEPAMLLPAMFAALIWMSARNQRRFSKL